MTIKNWIISVLGGVAKIDYDARGEIIEELENCIENAKTLFQTKVEANTKLRADVNDMLKSNARLVGKCEDLQKQNDIMLGKRQPLLEQIKELKLNQKAVIPTDTLQMFEYYNNKHKSKIIYYAGTNIKLRGRNKQLSVRVCDYIHITESMRAWLRDNNLMYDGNYTKESLSKHAWKVYSKFVTTTKYVRDRVLHDVSEHWGNNLQLPYIRNRGKIEGDCESLCNYCVGLMIASGIPEDMLRNTVGGTKLGGHSSLTCWDWRTSKFEQWETTSTTPMVVGEDSDILIIKVWFSFTQTRSYSDAPKTTYKSIK